MKKYSNRPEPSYINDIIKILNMLCHNPNYNKKNSNSQLLISPWSILIENLDAKIDVPKLNIPEIKSFDDLSTIHNKIINLKENPLNNFNYSFSFVDIVFGYFF